MMGRLPRRLAVSVIAAVTVVPIAASAASAAPAAPTAYTVYGSAQPLRWAGSSSLPVGDLHVPFVDGKTNNLAVGTAEASLAVPDERSQTLSGEDVHGLACVGYAEGACKDPFIMLAQAGHNGPKGAHAEQFASVGGRDGKFPGSIHATTDCPGDCGNQLIRSLSNATGPAGELAGYVSVGSSFASQELSIDDKGKLVSTARSQLDNVSIGPKNEVHFSSLVTSAQGFGSGAENTKDGKADLRISDFFILDNRVELTRAGLRLANGGPSEQEAYDGATVLLKKLKDQGINLELPNFDAQVSKTADHVTVDTQGLRVRFEQSVGAFQAAALSNPLELGHATAVVAALDADRHIDVKPNPNGGMVVESTPTSVPASGPRPGQSTGGTQATPSTRGTPGSTAVRPAPAGPGKDAQPPATSGIKPPTSATTGGEVPVTPPAEAGSSTTITNGADPGLADPTETALPSIGDLERNLGLRGAHSVSRAFGAFFGLGLILPLARFLIRRLG